MTTLVPLAKPPWNRLGRKLESMFRKALYEYKLIEGKTRISVALSGGKDSLTLLYMLKAISGRGFPDLEIFAIHISGEVSCGASLSGNYLKAICKELEVPLIIKESKQKLETVECYSCSRERRSLLFAAAKEVDAPTIAFGHHRDDSAQTLLLNLLHKGEFAANLPKVDMHHYGVSIIRPLIFIPEKDIVTFAQQQGFARITCQCPVGSNSMRKQTDRLLSEIQELFPNARENIARAGRLYGSDKANYI